jgi:hypothetical protein
MRSGGEVLIDAVVFRNPGSRPPEASRRESLYPWRPERSWSDGITPRPPSGPTYTRSTPVAANIPVVASISWGRVSSGGIRRIYSKSGSSPSGLWFVEALRRAYDQKELDLAGATEHLRDSAAWHAFVDALFETDWVVCAKPAFGGATAVLRYLGRYTHRVAIRNHRLLASMGSASRSSGRITPTTTADAR